MRATKTLFVGLILFTFTAEAARVVQSKNNKVMIDLEGEEAIPQQSLFLLNEQNKKVAIGKILQVKNGKAVAMITKGKSVGGETVQLNPMSADVGLNESAPTDSKKTDFVRTNAKKVSAVISLMNNTMNTQESDLTNTEVVAMKGTTFGLTGIVDWPLKYKLTLRGTAGYEPFKAAGTAKFKSCASLTSFECDADITYISGGAYLRYDFYQSKALFWGAIGATLKMPITKKATALKESDIQMTMTYAGAFGLDYFIDHKYFVPVSFEYQMFEKSATVDTNIMMLRAGFGMAL